MISIISVIGRAWPAWPKTSTRMPPSVTEIPSPRTFIIRMNAAVAVARMRRGVSSWMVAKAAPYIAASWKTPDPTPIQNTQPAWSVSRYIRPSGVDSSSITATIIGRPWPVVLSHQSPTRPPRMFPATPTVAYISATLRNNGPMSRCSSCFHQSASNWAPPTAKWIAMPPSMVNSRAGERFIAANSSGIRASMLRIA